MTCLFALPHNYAVQPTPYYVDPEVREEEQQLEQEVDDHGKWGERKKIMTIPPWKANCSKDNQEYIQNLSALSFPYRMHRGSSWKMLLSLPSVPTMRTLHGRICECAHLQVLQLVPSLRNEMQRNVEIQKDQ